MSLNIKNLEITKDRMENLLKLEMEVKRLEKLEMTSFHDDKTE